MSLRCLSNWRALPFCVVAAVAPAALAHPGPHHDIERLSAALAAEPDRVDLLIERAEAFRQDGNPSAALKDLDRAKSLDPKSRLVTLRRAETLSALHRDAEAEAEFDSYLLQPAPRASAYVERGRIRLRAGRVQAAVADFSAALALRDDVEVYLARGRAQERLGRLEDVAEGYREGLRRLPGAAVLVDELIRIETLLRRYDAALALVEKELDQSPVKTPWLLRRAEIQIAAGNKPAGEKDRQAALEDAARAVYRRASASNLLMRAKAHWALGDEAPARADCQAALRKAPNYAEASALLQQINRTGPEGAEHGAKR